MRAGHRSALHVPIAFWADAEWKGGEDAAEGSALEFAGIFIIIVLVASWCGDSGSRAVVGVDGRGPVRCGGGDCDEILVGARVAGRGCALVAACKDGDAAFHNPVRGTSIVDEVVQGLPLEVAILHPGLVGAVHRDPVEAVGRA